MPKKIGDADAVFTAPPDYIAKIGNLTQPYDLRYADFVNMYHGGMMLKGL
ncbi:MAG: hypothetical protein WBC93_05680 [Sulfitobacter sp.]